jgi:hypothetical protein
MKVVRLSAIRTGHLYPQEILLASISVKVPVDPRARVRLGGIMSMKNFNDTIGDRNRDPPASNAVPQPTASPLAHKWAEENFLKNEVI